MKKVFAYRWVGGALTYVSAALLTTIVIDAVKGNGVDGMALGVGVGGFAGGIMLYNLHFKQAEIAINVYNQQFPVLGINAVNSRSLLLGFNTKF